MEKKLCNGLYYCHVMLCIIDIDVTIHINSNQLEL